MKRSIFGKLLIVLLLGVSFTVLAEEVSKADLLDDQTYKRYTNKISSFKIEMGSSKAAVESRTKSIVRWQGEMDDHLLEGQEADSSIMRGIKTSIKTDKHNLLRAEKQIVELNDKIEIYQSKLDRHDAYIRELAMEKTKQEAEQEKIANARADIESITKELESEGIEVQTMEKSESLADSQEPLTLLTKRPDRVREEKVKLKEITNTHSEIESVTKELESEGIEVQTTQKPESVAESKEVLAQLNRQLDGVREEKPKQKKIASTRAEIESATKESESEGIEVQTAQIPESVAESKEVLARLSKQLDGHVIKKAKEAEEISEVKGNSFLDYLFMVGLIIVGFISAYFMTKGTFFRKSAFLVTIFVGFLIYVLLSETREGVVLLFETIAWTGLVAPFLLFFALILEWLIG